MADNLRIICPDTSLSKSERIDVLFTQIQKWITSDSLIALVQLFNGDINFNLPLKELIDILNNFSNVWDYRKKQANGGERWDIYNDEFVEKNSDEIRKLTAELGLKSITEPIESPTHILPLGGARLANLVRCQKAREVMGNIEYNNPKVIALGGMRQINEIEREFLKEYAPNANTEFDAINGGLLKSFNLNYCSYEENGYLDNNPNFNWAIRKYNSSMDIYSIAAPSSDENRRANSMDTFEFFMKKFSIKDSDKILLVTSCIYVPFQFLKFMSLAIKNNIYIDCIGAESSRTGVQFSKASNYLQETKATINAIKSLSDEFLK